MNDYLTIVSLFLFLGSLYLLAWANLWSIKASIALIFAVFGLPVLLLMLSFIFPVPQFFRSVIENVAPIAAMIALFALSKPLANRAKNR